MNRNYYNQDYEEKLRDNNQVPQSNVNYLDPNQTESVPNNFLEDNLRINIGKTATFHMSFPDSQKERDMIFEGQIYEVARDHVVIQNPDTGIWYLLPLIYLNYAEMFETPNLFSQ